MANIRKLLADEEFIQRITASGATAAAVHRDYVRPIYGFSVSSVNRAWKELEYQARTRATDPPHLDRQPRLHYTRSHYVPVSYFTNRKPHHDTHH